MKANEEIFLFFDERLKKNLMDVAEETAFNAGIIFNNTPTLVALSGPIPGMKGSDFTKAGRIVATSSTYGTQRDASQIIDEIHKRLKQTGRRIIFITVDDLTCTSNGKYLNFCFGLARGYSTALSMVRFGSLSDKEQEIVLSGLIMHELGHLYGLAADSNRKKTEFNIGMHCTDKYCVMQQGLTMGEIRKNFSRVNEHRGHTDDVKLKYYCPLCMQDANNYFAPKKRNNFGSSRPLPPRREAG